MSALILPLNKYNIINYRNSTNNGDSDKNCDSNSDGVNDGDSHAKITHIQDKPGILVNDKKRNILGIAKILLGLF